MPYYAQACVAVVTPTYQQAVSPTYQQLFTPVYQQHLIAPVYLQAPIAQIYQQPRPQAPPHHNTPANPKRNRRNRV